MNLLRLVVVVVAAACLAAAFFRPRTAETLGDFWAPCNEMIDGVHIDSWAFQLQKIDPDRIARSATDLVVIDYSRNGTEAGALAPDTVAKMRRKPDGERRLVLAYLSIGEAESYRFYWRKEWRRDPPRWLGPENPDWPNNYKVRYWHDAWQRILVTGPDSYLDKIIAAGFDGVYLDVVDAFHFWEEDHSRAPADMVRLIEKIAGHARAKKDGFVVISQNGEELLTSRRFRRVIDAIAKEDLFYGIEGDGVANTSEQIETSLDYLKLAQKAELPTLVVEYISDRSRRQAAQALFSKHGLIGTFAQRDLDSLIESPFAKGKAGSDVAAARWCGS